MSLRCWIGSGSIGDLGVSSLGRLLLRGMCEVFGGAGSFPQQPLHYNLPSVFLGMHWHGFIRVAHLADMYGMIDDQC